MADKTVPEQLSSWSRRFITGQTDSVSNLAIANTVALWFLVLFVFIIMILAAVGVSARKA